MSTVRKRAAEARSAARVLLGTTTAERSAALEAVARALEERGAQIEAANQEDLARADRDGLAAPLRKRLGFSEAKRAQSVAGVRTVAGLADPLGRVVEHRELDDGLTLKRVTAPIGVIAMVFESRPDALVQIAALALKSGNAVVLKGGSEALESNRALAGVIHGASVDAGMPRGWIQLIESRAEVRELLELDDLIDLMIPRGSNEFVRAIMDGTRIPVLGHADGICHVYVDAASDAAVAERVVVDSKTQYVAVCNAAETLLVHAATAETTLPQLAAVLQAAGVRLRGCARSRALVPSMAQADEQDWSNEYLDLEMSVRVVDSVDDAIEHINRYGSHHTDAIVSTDEATCDRFVRLVDSASVMVNASTRFADGFRYGLGAEVGISTSKIHARGPVGVMGLVTSRWIVRGSGHIVAEYGGDGGRSYTHRDLPL